MIKYQLTNPTRLPVRRAPYSERIAKGVALLLYRGKRGDRWGARTQFGDRVIGDVTDLTYEAARTMVQDIVRAEAKTGTKVTDPGADPDAATFGDVWNAYLDWCRSTGKTELAMVTINGHTRAFDNIRDMKVSTTPLATLSRWRDGLIGRTNGSGTLRTPGSVAANVRALKAALNRAEIDGPWRGLKAGSKKVAKSRTIIALTGDDLARYIAEAYVYDRDMGVFVEALALTGARPNELRLADVRDLEPAGLRIRHGKTKDKTGDRIIPLTPAARALFTGLTRETTEPDAPLLGKRWKVGEKAHAHRQIAGAAGVPGATLYSLRHGYISAALAAGVPPLSVAKACGTSISQIDKTYGHILADREREIWNAFEPVGQKLRAV